MSSARGARCVPHCRPGLFVCRSVGSAAARRGADRTAVHVALRFPSVGRRARQRRSALRVGDALRRRLRPRRLRVRPRDRSWPTLENILGTEFRAFDPNQANYTLDIALSARTPHVELFFVFHHVSRHFTDRPKIVAIAWNVAQARALRRLTIGGDDHRPARRMSGRSPRTRSWTTAGPPTRDVLVRRRLSEHVGIYARGYVETFGIDEALSSRSSADGRTHRGRAAAAGVRWCGRVVRGLRARGRRRR